MLHSGSERKGLTYIAHLHEIQEELQEFVWNTVDNFNSFHDMRHFLGMSVGTLHVALISRSQFIYEIVQATKRVILASRRNTSS